MKYKFYVKDIPDSAPIWAWIKKNTDIERLFLTVKPKVNGHEVLNLKHSFDIDYLSKITLDMFDTYGFKGWKSSKGEDHSYGGLSLTMNPDYSEDSDPNQQTLGTSKNRPTDFFYKQMKNFTNVKNTYYDSYAFRKPSPCVSNTEFGSFVKSFKRSHIRSRLAVINSEFVTPEQRKTFGWHRDEIVFENLRINIPIKTDPTYLFQLENQTPIHLDYGNVYSWDTNLTHRVYPTTNDQRFRVHLVFGFSPWFDYNEEDDSFTSNEFYGEMHPLDMLVEGHVHQSILGLK